MFLERRFDLRDNTAVLFLRETPIPACQLSGGWQAPFSSLFPSIVKIFTLVTTSRGSRNIRQDSSDAASSQQEMKLGNESRGVTHVQGSST